MREKRRKKREGEKIEKDFDLFIENKNYQPELKTGNFIKCSIFT